MRWPVSTSPFPPATRARASCSLPGRKPPSSFQAIWSRAQEPATRHTPRSTTSRETWPSTCRRRHRVETISFDEAAFATIGAIALHGVRLGRPQLGERVAVIGLGLVGLLAGQILRAHGCRVLGIDPVPARRALAEQLGFAATASPEAAPSHNLELTRGHGADIVIIAAAAEGSAPVILAGELARDRATVVAIGATGLDLPRRSYYQKELSVVVSRSYGPGRYDAEFEERGRDYPIGYVRWTERENLRAVLELVADGRVVVEPLISARVTIEDAESAYSLLDTPGTLGVVLTYPVQPHELKLATRVDLAARGGPVQGAVGVSVIGAGAFGQGVLLPALKTIDGITRRGIVTAGGVNARSASDRFGFAFCASDADAVFADEETRAVIIATRHDQHAALVERAVAAGKAVFVEKPLALSEPELTRLCEVVDEAAAHGRPPLVMVGFNRRFAPIVREVLDWRRRLAGPVTVCYRINAGKLPAGSWIANPSEGGGRLLGEVCHFVDLSTVIAGAPIAQVFAQGSAAQGADDATVTLKFEDGSLASIVYVVERRPLVREGARRGVRRGIDRRHRRFPAADRSSSADREPGSADGWAARTRAIAPSCRPSSRRCVPERPARCRSTRRSPAPARRWPSRSR